MQIRKCTLYAALTLLAALLVVPSASAQPPGGGRGFGFGGGFRGGGSNLLGLLRVEEVQKEIEALGDQLEAAQKLEEQLREGRPEVDFRNMTDADREKLRAWGEKQAKAAKEKLAEILLPNQLKRLEEIALQQQGTRALSDEEVAAKLKLTAQQKEKIEKVSEENRESMRERMQAIFQGGNRENARAEMEKLRAEMDGKFLAVLTKDQQTQFKAMQGEPFEMPERQFGRGGGNRGGGEGNTGGRRGRGRPSN